LNRHSAKTLGTGGPVTRSTRPRNLGAGAANAKIIFADQSLLALKQLILLLHQLQAHIHTPALMLADSETPVNRLSRATVPSPSPDSKLLTAHRIAHER